MNFGKGKMRSNTKKLTKKQQKLISNNIGLLYAYYHNLIKNNHVPKSECPELLHMMHIAMCHASRRYDPSLAKFSTYVYGAFKLSFFSFRRYLRSIGKEPITFTDIFTNAYGEEVIGNDKVLLDKSPEKHLNVDFLALHNLIDKAHLNNQEMNVLCDRYGKNETYREIGERMNVSKQRPEQVLKKALAKIREAASERGKDITDFIL